MRKKCKLQILRLNVSIGRLKKKTLTQKKHSIFLRNAHAILSDFGATTPVGHDLVTNPQIGIYTSENGPTSADQDPPNQDSF